MTAVGAGTALSASTETSMLATTAITLCLQVAAIACFIRGVRGQRVAR